MLQTRAVLLMLLVLVALVGCHAALPIPTSSVQRVPPSQNYFTSSSSSFYPWFHVISNHFCARSCVLELFGCVSINQSIDEKRDDLVVVQTIATMNLPSTTQPAVGQPDRLSSFLMNNSSLHSRDAHQAHATCTLPSSSISGDGYIALFSAQVGKVYLSYHHTAATIVCINVYTGSICAHADARTNIPALSSFAYVGTPAQYGGQTMFSNRWMYTTVAAYPASDGSLGCTWGIMCFDTQLNQFCTSTATAGLADAGWLALGSTTLHCPQPGISGGL